MVIGIDVVFQILEEIIRAYKLLFLTIYDILYISFKEFIGMTMCIIGLWINCIMVSIRWNIVRREHEL